MRNMGFFSSGCGQVVTYTLKGAAYRSLWECLFIKH
jgi:hypothetical protein